MLRGRTRAVLSVALAIACSLSLAGQASAFIYWTDGNAGTIGRASSEGSHVEPAFITGADAPCGVTADDEFIYWAESAGTIGRARLDGTHVNHSFITGPYLWCGPSTDAGQLYWAVAKNTNAGRVGSVGHASASGVGVNENFIQDPFGWAIATASFDGYLYWTNFSIQGQEALWRATDEGSDAEAFVPPSTFV